jgi:hypothetical protein
MAYRVNALFKDGLADGFLVDVIAAPTPRYGDTILVSRRGQDVPVRVTAVWRPVEKTAGRETGTLVMVEAQEI